MARRTGGRQRRIRDWGLLIAVTAAITGLFHLLAVPAAFLLGPMVAGIVVAARGLSPGVPRGVAVGGQAIVGCLIAGGMAGALGPAFRDQWPVFAVLTAGTIAASGALGYALSRMGVVPGTVAIWGSMPGGAAAMVMMAEAQGADARLVAVMVYTRVVTVTFAATALAALLGAGTAAPAVAGGGGGPAWLTLAVAGTGVGIARLLRWPAGTLLFTMAIGVALEAAGAPRLRVPGPVMVAALAAIGWRIGLGFTDQARGAARRMLPRIVLAALALSLFCGLMALALHRWLGIDLLTAWLATSPGGLESVAVIATALPVDTAFIMTAQAARFAAVMLVGPPIASALARRSRRRARADDANA